MWRLSVTEISSKLNL